MAKTKTTSRSPKRRATAEPVHQDSSRMVPAASLDISADDDLEELPPRRLTKETVLSVRLDQPTMQRLNQAAERLGVGASTVARMWILKRLSEEPAQPGDEWV